MDIFKDIRKSKMLPEEVYFWTNTVYQWKHLLKPDKYKDLIIQSLTYLVQHCKIRVYGFVIMPNHLHLLWEMVDRNGKEMVDRNGKEMPYTSFQKFTAHAIQEDLKSHHPKVLAHFSVNEKGRKYRFWQRDPLAVKMESRTMVEQKLDYLHNNPLQPQWNLAKIPEDYHYSSAIFYETGSCSFDFLTYYMERFG